MRPEVTNATDLAKHDEQTNAVERSGLGLAPDDILVYVERGEGQADAPSAKRREERQIGRTSASHGMEGQGEGQDQVGRSRSSE